jgi:hypothetical protein
MGFIPKAIGGAVKGIGKGLGGIAKLAAPVAGLIPGVGTLGSLALGGIGGLLSGKSDAQGGASFVNVPGIGPVPINLAQQAQQQQGGGGGGFFGTLGKIGSGIGKFLGFGQGQDMDALMRLGGLGAGAASVVQSGKDRKRQQEFISGMSERANLRDEFNRPLREQGRAASLAGLSALDDVDIFGSHFTQGKGGQASGGSGFANDAPKGKPVSKPQEQGKPTSKPSPIQTVAAAMRNTARPGSLRSRMDRAKAKQPTQSQSPFGRAFANLAQRRTA